MVAGVSKVTDCSVLKIHMAGMPALPSSDAQGGQEAAKQLQRLGRICFRHHVPGTAHRGIDQAAVVHRVPRHLHMATAAVLNDPSMARTAR